MQRWIVAMGGGGFSMEGGRSRLDDEVLRLAAHRRGRDRPRVCFIATASGDDAGYIDRFHAAFSERAETSHLALFARTVEDIPAFLAGQDAIYVGGGNTASLLAVWRAHGVDHGIQAAHAAGVVLAGVSAGAICWFDGGTTDSYGPTLQPVTGALGLIPGSCSPHYDGEPQRRPTYQALVASGALPAGIAVDDHAAAVFDGPSLVEVVASHRGPAAYRVEPVSMADGGVVESVLPARVLPRPRSSWSSSIRSRRRTLAHWSARWPRRELNSPRITGPASSPPARPAPMWWPAHPTVAPLASASAPSWPGSQRARAWSSSGPGPCRASPLLSGAPSSRPPPARPAGR
ncbi:MAG: peptidase E [Candidatus Limnocylindrales bacterium]